MCTGASGVWLGAARKLEAYLTHAGASAAQVESRWGLGGHLTCAGADGGVWGVDWGSEGFWLFWY